MANATIAVVCAWCGSTLREGAGERVSHGVCAACSSMFLREAHCAAAGPSYRRHRKRQRCRRWSGVALLGATVAPVVLARAWVLWGSRFRQLTSRAGIG
ncbi:MAG: hypothetical protein M0R74_02535 [Dehalococcoidia bacterium]|nr:hypothetical protein [Dehalococcoidia bacterium]